MQVSTSALSSAAPGTTLYLPELLARARAAHPDIPVDPVILQCVLLCLIAQARLPPGSRTHTQVGLHLILRTKEDDVGLVVNLVTLILQHILGVSSHKHKIPSKVNSVPGAHTQSRRTRTSLPLESTPSDSPDALLRSLFFRRARRTSLSSHRSSTPRPRSGVSTDTISRSGPNPLQAQWKNSRSNGYIPQHSVSYPALSTDGDDDDRYFDAASLASSRRPLLAGQGTTPASTIRSRGSRGRPAAHRLRTDPLPLSSLFTPPGSLNVAETPEEFTESANISPEPVHPQKSIPASERTNESGGNTSALPRAVVVSGLEHASVPAQRALMRVLAERRIIFDGREREESDLSGQEPDGDDGTWNLPDGFVMIYVCKWDPHERPPVLRGLVNHFSMSADVSLLASVRQGYLAYRAAHNTSTPRSTPICSPLALPQPGHTYFATPSPVHHSPVRRPVPLPPPVPQAPPVLSASELAQLRTHARPYPTAAPIFYPSVHATTQLHTVTPLPPQPPPYAALHPSLDLYLLDLFAATRHHPELDGTLLSMRAHADAEAIARAFRVLNGDSVGTALVYHEARAAPRDPQGTIVPDSADGASWADGWRSTESVVTKLARADRDGRSAAAGEDKELQDAHGSGEEEHMGIRVRVDGEDGSHRSFSAGYDRFAESEMGVVGMGVSMRMSMSPAEALDAAVARSWPEVWDVSEEDVARIFPRVVSHRLRVRDGPDDEILSSVMWPAVPPDVDNLGASMDGTVREGEDGVVMGWERRSVKEILVRILADV